MKVLHIINGLSDGGAESLLYRFCLSDKENKHIVISLKDGKKYEQLLNDIDIEVYCLNFQDIRFKLLGFLRLVKLIKRFKPDAVQTWMIHANFIGGLAARLAGIKNVFWGIHHSSLSRGSTKRATLFIFQINIFLSYLVPKRIIYCAKNSRDIQESIGFKKKIGIVVQNGYDTDEFAPNSNSELMLRSELSISQNTFIIGYVGRYHPDKDIPNLIQALKYIDQSLVDFNAVFVGTNLDNDNQELENLLDEHRLSKNAHMIGQRTDIPIFMNGIDLLVLSSRFEAFPNVLNEAMACGKPCVSTDVGDAALIINNTGWVVHANDPKALANAINEAIDEKQSNSISWHQRKDACRNRIVKNYSLKKMTKKYIEVWADCI